MNLAALCQGQIRRCWQRALNILINPLKPQPNQTFTTSQLSVSFSRDFSAESERRWHGVGDVPFLNPPFVRRVSVRVWSGVVGMNMTLKRAPHMSQLQHVCSFTVWDELRLLRADRGMRSFCWGSEVPSGHIITHHQAHSCSLHPPAQNKLRCLNPFLSTPPENSARTDRTRGGDGV